MKKQDFVNPDAHLDGEQDQSTEKTKSMVQEQEKQVEEWKQKYFRALADYQNLERRVQAEKTEIRNFAAQVLIERLLPVVDTFERAQTHLHDSGLALALKQFNGVLTERGLERIQTIGLDFNPHEMECVDVVPGEDNVVVEEFTPGYRLNGKVIRAAQVKVGKSVKSTT